MSVIVKGMEMPAECMRCPMSRCVGIGSNVELMCTRLRRSVPDEEGCRDEECPITEIKTPHGKLVDFDAMINEFWDGYYMEIHSRDVGDIPVIVEAEGI